ncbi:hypothetical protein PV11_03634 [Exophiala sideris]|uniref:Uncharacterized protein n=1 Tax=Exophiala sideris TaxID=1016849 RepID=A0A0D1VYI8_9EURO|nr:hypothetical protein PV11_03634 [Exophiala sideris]
MSTHSARALSARLGHGDQSPESGIITPDTMPHLDNSDNASQMPYLIHIRDEHTSDSSTQVYLHEQSAVRVNEGGPPDCGEAARPKPHVSSVAPDNVQEVAVVPNKGVPAEIIRRRPVARSQELDLPEDQPMVVQPTSDPSMAEQFMADQPTAMWNPIWLHVVVLGNYAALALLFLIALVVLYVYSERNHGISTQWSSNHYLWTYGPTAVLTLALVPWNRLSHLCKLLAPFQNMASGPTAADRSLLLNYLSPLEPQMLWQAGKARNYAVVASESGTIIWKLTIILSTALLSLQTLVVAIPNAISERTAAFAVESFHFTNTNTTGTAGRTYYGILANGVQYPPGTAPTFATQPFQLDDVRFLDRDYQLRADVEVFDVGVDCEPAAVTVTDLDTAGNSLSANVRTSDCSVNYDGILYDPTRWYTYTLTKKLPAENFVPTAIPVACDDRTYNSGSIFQGTESHIMLFLSLTDNKLNPVTLTAVICRPLYSISTQTVNFDSELAGTNMSTEVDWDRTRSNLTMSPTFSSQFTYAVLTEASSQFLTLTNTGSISEAQSKTSGIFTLMSVLQGRKAGQSTLRPFLAVETMMSRVQQVFQGVAAQVAGADLLKPALNYSIGRVSIRENRLIVQLLPVIFMGIGFGLLAIISILLICLRPRDTVPRRVEGAFDTLCVLSSSLGLERSLHGSGSANDTQLTERLRDRHFRSITPSQAANVSTTFIVTQDEECSSLLDEAKSSSSASSEWWLPWSIRPAGRVITIIVPVAVIALLEVLQRISYSRNGFTTIDTSQSAADHAKSIVPASVMVVIALIYGSLDDSTNILSPYVALTKGLPPAKRRLGSRSTKVSAGYPAHVHGKISLAAFIIAVQSGYFASCFTIVTAFLAPFLTILSSGLYVIEPEVKVGAVEVYALDTFNASWSGSYSSDSGANADANQILNNGADYPQWTYQDIALPALSSDMDLSRSGVGTESGNLSILMPALRGRLDCHVTRPGDVQYELTDSSELNTTIQILDTCGGGSGVIKSFSILTELSASPDGSTSSTNSSVPNQRYIAAIENLHVSNGVWNDQSQYVSHTPPDNPDGCPSLLFYAANISMGTTLDTISADLTALSCRQILQQVPVNASLTYPAFAIDKSRPPTTNERDVSDLDNGTTGVTGRTYQIANWLSEFQNKLLPTSNGTAEYEINNFYNSVAFAEGFPIENLFGQQNVESFITAVEYGYSTYMAQAISSNMRTTIPTSANGSGSAQPNDIAFTATLQTPLRANLTQPAADHYRLKQDNASKIALQAILGTMVVCALAAWICTGNTKVLPHNPCSIAGVASLFAGSDRLWSGHSWEEEELRSGGLRMGWHNSRPTQVANIGDDGDGAKEGQPKSEERDRWFGIDTIR